MWRASPQYCQIVRYAGSLVTLFTDLVNVLTRCFYVVPVLLYAGWFCIQRSVVTYVSVVPCVTVWICWCITALRVGYWSVGGGSVLCSGHVVAWIVLKTAMLLQTLQNCIEDLVSIICVLLVEVIIICWFLVYVEFLYCIEVDTLLMEL